MNTLNAYASRSSGLARLVLVAALALITSYFGIPAAAAGDTPNNGLLVQISTLANSPEHPLPVLPTLVPELISEDQIQQLLTETKDPYLFMLYQAKGPQAADQAKDLGFFMLLSLEYMGNSSLEPAVKPVHFRTIAVDKTPAAAEKLYSTDAVKPVYILFDPSKTGKTSGKFWTSQRSMTPVQNLDSADCVKDGFKRSSVSVPPS